jgi:hypothetical protein
MFNHLKMELQVREAVAEGARLRVRAAFLTAASVAIAVAGVFLAAKAARGPSESAVALAALIAFAAATPPAVWAYWAWRDVRRRDSLVVDVVSAFAERFVASQVDAPERRARKDGPDLATRERVTTSPDAASHRQPLTV